MLAFLLIAFAPSMELIAMAREPERMVVVNYDAPPLVIPKKFFDGLSSTEERRIPNPDMWVQFLQPVRITDLRPEQEDFGILNVGSIWALSSIKASRGLRPNRIEGNRAERAGLKFLARLIKTMSNKSSSA